MAYLDAASISKCLTKSSTFYSSGTVVATGDTGVIATPLYTDGGAAILPVYFAAVGSSMATDETNDIVVTFYADAAGAMSIGAITFNQLTAGSPQDLEVWPGDVTAFNAGRDFVPLFPYCKIAHTLAGTTKSMSYVITCFYVTFAGS